MLKITQIARAKSQAGIKITSFFAWVLVLQSKNSNWEIFQIGSVSCLVEHGKLYIATKFSSMLVSQLAVKVIQQQLVEPGT